MNFQAEAKRLAKELDLPDFEREETLYWWLAVHHSGQGSDEYTYLSTSDYRPGASMSEQRLDMGEKMLYDALCASRGCGHELFGKPPGQRGHYSLDYLTWMTNWLNG